MLELSEESIKPLDSLANPLRSPSAISHDSKGFPRTFEDKLNFLFFFYNVLGLNFPSSLNGEMERKKSCFCNEIYGAN